MREDDSHTDRALSAPPASEREGPASRDKAPGSWERGYDALESLVGGAKELHVRLVFLERKDIAGPPDSRLLHHRVHCLQARHEGFLCRTRERTRSRRGEATSFMSVQYTVARMSTPEPSWTKG